jgi:D-sedoheptulose 7-phosphate isomerase
MQKASQRLGNKGKIREVVRKSLHETAALLERVAGELDVPIAEAAIRIERALRRGRKILLFGNGGSAADAQHIAAELVGRFEKERRPLPAIALVSNPASITAIGNDYGFETIFARQVMALAREGDVLVGISTSGNSANVREALRAGRALGCFRIGLLGRDGGMVKKEVDLAITVPSQRTCRIQEVHIAIGHIICTLLEERLFDERETE